MKRKIAALPLIAIFALSAGCQSLDIEREPTASRAAVTVAEQSETIATETSVAVTETSHVTETTTAEITESEITYVDEEKESFSISFVGDTTQSGLFGDATDNNGTDYAFAEVRAIFEGCDISLANLETCISTRGVSEKKEGYGFRSSPDKLEVYTNAGIDIVSVANNHVRDFGMDALSDTFTYLEQYGIQYVGAGRNLSEARSLKTLDANGFTVGFVGYNMIMHDDSWYAADTRAGIAGLNGANEAEILSEVEEYNEQCDVLIVSIHWGYEYLNEATQEQRTLAHKLSDSGADLIIGHHPHVLEPVEMYNGTPIFYSIGNFLFFKMDDEAGQSAVFTAEFDKNGFVGAKLYPVLISYCRARLLPSDDEGYAEILTRLNNISMPYGTRVSEDGEISFGHAKESPPTAIEGE